MMTKAVHASAQRQLVVALKELNKTRHHALSVIALARNAGNTGKLRIAREDQIGAYIMARAYLKQRRRQLQDVIIL